MELKACYKEKRKKGIYVRREQDTKHTVPTLSPVGERPAVDWYSSPLEFFFWGGGRTDFGMSKLLVHFISLEKSEFTLL